MMNKPTCRMIGLRRNITPTRTRCARNCTEFWRRQRRRNRCLGDAQRTALYRTIFPQMTNGLPGEEGAQLRFDIDTELARLKAA